MQNKKLGIQCYKKCQGLVKSISYAEGQGQGQCQDN